MHSLFDAHQRRRWQKLVDQIKAIGKVVTDGLHQQRRPRFLLWLRTDCKWRFPNVEIGGRKCAKRAYTSETRTKDAKPCTAGDQS
ncbi:hypothetical protein O9992_17475 [Vibrio lentus]|nr:hypothetical protein [Vibrio lentus]